MHDDETDGTSGQVEPVKSKRELPPALAAEVRRGDGAGKGAGHGGPAKGAGWGGPAKGMPPRGERALFGKGNKAAAKST